MDIHPPGESCPDPRGRAVNPDDTPLTLPLASPGGSQYDNGMSNPPMVLQGQVQAIQPTRIAAAHAASAHRFFNVIRDILHKSGYHTEGELLAALDAVAQYEQKVMTPGDLLQVTGENDRAAVEDVSKRIAPQSGLGMQPVMTTPIDYDKLAAALIAAQAAAAAQQSQQTTTPEVPAT